MNEDRRPLERVGPLAAGAILLFAGAAKYPGEHSDAFVAVGFVVLGIWLAVEVGHIVEHRLLRRRDRKDDKDDGPYDAGPDPKAR